MNSYSFAHHELSDDVNFGSLIQFGGTITGIEWAEPHVLIRVTSNPKSTRSAQWLVLIDSPSRLAPEDINIDTFETLDHVSFIGYPSRNNHYSGESLIYGLYHARSPTDRILLYEDLLILLEKTKGLKTEVIDNGAVFRADP